MVLVGGKFMSAEMAKCIRKEVKEQVNKEFCRLVSFVCFAAMENKREISPGFQGHLVMAGDLSINGRDVFLRRAEASHDIYVILSGW